MDAFESADGYVFLAELLLSDDVTDDVDSSDALRNLILLIGSLTTCGFIELKPSSPPSGNMSGFRLPRPMGRGVSVRNIKAFQVLQTVWLRSSSQLITSTILDVILSLYQQDPANYFILLPQQTIKTVCQGGLATGEKPSSNMGRFFRIVEWVGLNLGYMLFDELKWIHRRESSLF